MLVVDALVDHGLVVHSGVAEQLLLNDGIRLVDDVDGVDVFGGEVLAGALVAVDGEVAVAVKVGDAREGTVDGDVLHVDSDTVAAGVVVGEEAGLQNRVVGGLPAWYNGSGRKVRLLDLGEEVVGVLSEHDPAYFVVGDALVAGGVGLQPILGEVVNVVGVRISLLLGHGCDTHGPGWVVAICNCLVQVVRCPGFVAAPDLCSFGVGEVLHALVGRDEHAAVDPATIVVDELVCMSGPTAHVAEAVRSTKVGEETDKLQQRLGELAWPAPEGVPVSHVGLRVSLLSVDESRELGWVADEEAWRVLVFPFNDATRRKTYTGVLLNTQSRIPWLVRILMEKPLGSRAWSALPRAPPTVEKRAVTDVRVPFLKTSAAESFSA